MGPAATSNAAVLATLGSGFRYYGSYVVAWQHETFISILHYTVYAR